MFRTGGLLTAGLAASETAQGSVAKIPGPEVYTRIGVRPFINCTATYTINGGSQMLPEVISTIEQASYHHVNIDELMEKVGDRLAELLQVGWGIVTAGAAAALTHATAGVLAGTDPEKIQRLPNLEGLKDEVIIPRESRNPYDHAVRTLGVKVIEVSSPDELRAAISPHTDIRFERRSSHRAPSRHPDSGGCRRRLSHRSKSISGARRGSRGL
jgi:seryl-tRNA(Sec) selenium transferase